jgi:hypothetical protein
MSNSPRNIDLKAKPATPSYLDLTLATCMDGNLYFFCCGIFSPGNIQILSGSHLPETATAKGFESHYTAAIFLRFSEYGTIV